MDHYSNPKNKTSTFIFELFNLIGSNNWINYLSNQLTDMSSIFLVDWIDRIELGLNMYKSIITPNTMKVIRKFV